MRIGFGTDLHRLRPGNGLWLGGIRIDCELESVAHSDGDCLLHALTDALLGALAQGDIGDLFPDTASENRQRPSSDFVREAVRRVGEAGARIANLDAVIHLQRPKLSQHKEMMRRHIAGLCGCSMAQVSLKAKTGEGVDAVGRGEAVACQVAVLLETGL